MGRDRPGTLPEHHTLRGYAGQRGLPGGEPQVPGGQFEGYVHPLHDGDRDGPGLGPMEERGAAVERAGCTLDDGSRRGRLGLSEVAICQYSPVPIRCDMLSIIVLVAVEI